MVLARASARRVAGKNQPPRRPHIGPFPRRRHENPRLGFTRAPARRSRTFDEPSSPKVRLPSSRRGRRRVVHPAHVLTESSHARPTPAIHRHASSRVHPFVRPRSTPPTASRVRVGVSLDDERAHERIHDADRAPRQSAQTPRFPRPRGPIARDVRRRVRGRHRASRARASRSRARRGFDGFDGRAIRQSLPPTDHDSSVTHSTSHDSYPRLTTQRTRDTTATSTARALTATARPRSSSRARAHRPPWSRPSDEAIVFASSPCTRAPGRWITGA